MIITGQEAEKANIVIGQPVKSEKATVTFLGRNGRLVIGENVTFKNVNIYISDNAHIEIGASSLYRGSLRALANCTIKLGDSTRCNGYLNISSAEATNVTLGNGCLIASATVRPSDMHSIYDLETGTRINRGKDIVIGNNVWLAQDCIILKGTTIGDGSVIAANAVVTTKVPPNSVAAGNPARIVRSNIRWDHALT